MIVRMLIVVTAAVKDQANALAAQFDTIGGEQTFRVELSPDGALPVTHYWCSVALPDAVRAQIESAAQPLIEAGQCWIYDGLTTEPNDVLAQLGLQRMTV